jgi:hypothetical protein
MNQRSLMSKADAHETPEYYDQNEENGARGAAQYKENREDELATTSFALESDSGVFWYTGHKSGHGRVRH